MHKTFSKEDLLQFRPKHPTFAGIDSDGCVFDSMEIKQKKCFHPAIIAHWHLEPIAQYVREAAQYVNLYSTKRGRNRFPCLVDVFDLLRDRPEVVASGVTLPDFQSLRKWIASGDSLGNPRLEELVKTSGDKELASVFEWSKTVNRIIKDTVKKIPPFKWALKSLQKIHENSDAICVSQTPTEALVREWDENDITKYVALIAGQELGTKSEHIAMATKGRYAGTKIIMIGDAPGDLQAARANRALFFPVNPGHEEESWELFFKEAYARFLKGAYAGAYERKLVKAFQKLLPANPPWKK